MIKIASVYRDGVISPERAIPDDAIAVVYDGVEFLVYQRGDTVPHIQYQEQVED